MLRHIRTILSIIRENDHPYKTIWTHGLLKSGLSKFVRIKMNGYKIHLSPSNLAITLFSNKHFGDVDEGFLRKTLQPGNTYIDVGANIGTLVMTGAISVENNGQVIGIEAHPKTFNVLKNNIKLNDFNNIKLINSAVGNEKGKLHFSDTKADDMNKILLESDEGVEVMVETLDELLKDINTIDVLKIDVEGFEKQVFEGARLTLEKTKLVYYESFENNYTSYNYNTGDITKLLNDLQFSVFKVIDNDTLTPLNTQYRSIVCENLLATRTPEALEKRYDFRIIKN